MKNKSLIIGGIVLSLMIVLSIGTYAYWTITRSQDGENTLIGGCLSIDISEEGEAISLDKAWPISDFEGMQLEGYTFKVTNDCEEPQDYRIDLDRLVDSEGRKEMSNEYLTTLLDYGVPVVYSELETGESTEEGIQEKRVLAYDTVMGGETNEHTLRLWIDETSPVEEQGSQFLSKVQINAGQGIEKYYTPEECFTFDSANGSITAYDETKTGCTTDVVIPYEIGGEAVTQIGNYAFKEKGLTSVEFPRSVTTTGVHSFSLNPTIKKIVFKDGLLSIGGMCFAAVTTPPVEVYGKLEFVMFPETLTSIGQNSFVHNSLKQVVIPDSVTRGIGLAFKGNWIKNVKIGTGVDWKLSSSAFLLNEIEELIIPDHVTTYVGTMFSNNPIKKIVIGKGLTSLPMDAFNNDGGMSNSVYPNRNVYEDEMFIKEVYIPANIIKIGDEAFSTATSDIIIRTERTKEDFLANVTISTIGFRWYGDAQVISSDGLLIYE